VLGITTQVYGQSAASLLQSAKQEFKKDYTIQNMPQTVLDLKKALALAPNNPEITYHLAYALDRVYTADASWIASSNLTKVEEISKYLEQTIRLSPRYIGEKLPLDPYSKLGSVWGNLALGFLFRNLPDSARWAFQEGKRKGAYARATVGARAQPTQQLQQKCDPVFSRGTIFPSLVLPTNRRKPAQGCTGARHQFAQF